MRTVYQFLERLQCIREKYSDKCGVFGQIGKRLTISNVFLIGVPSSLLGAILGTTFVVFVIV
jgi:hypothetical protein